MSETLVHPDKHEVRLGEISVWRAAVTAEALRSAHELACESGQDIHRVSFLLNGTVTVCWDGGEVEYGPYDLFHFDPAQPSTIRTNRTDEPLRAVGVNVPKALVALPERRGEKVVPRPVSGRSGIGALFSDFLVRLATDAGSYPPADGPRIGVVTAGLVSTLLTHTLDTERKLPAGRTLAMEIRAFIRQHLHDPRLSPRAIAAAHHISTSYLHRLFRREGVAVSAWIRQQRLDAARRDLADPALSDVPVHTIAARWGFPHHATFTRAFRTAYGDTPTRFRPDSE